MSDEFEDAPYQPAEDLWEDTEQEVPEWAESPAVPDGPRCAITMCGDGNANLLSLGCTHFLHAGCMRKVLRSTQNPQCPMCRDGYLTHMRQIIESSPFRGNDAPVSYELPGDNYGPPEPQPNRPSGSTRYGEQFDPTPRGNPISYGGRYRHQDCHKDNQTDARPGPRPRPAIGKINMMGLEARQYMQ